MLRCADHANIVKIEAGRPNATRHFQETSDVICLRVKNGQISDRGFYAKSDADMLKADIVKCQTVCTFLKRENRRSVSPSVEADDRPLFRICW
jgi:hypothetical protein